MNLDLLVQSISDVHRQLQAQAVHVVNTGLTVRNWLIGAYISEYVSRYQTHLPDAKELENFVNHEIKSWEEAHSS